MDKLVEAVEKSPPNGPLGVVRGGRRVVLGIFAKEPVVGKVKTRLCPPFTPAQAARLYGASLKETVATLNSFSPVIFYAGRRNFFRRTFPGMVLIPQVDGGLGRRMCHALEALMESGADSAALIGSDSPDIPVALVEEAFDVLEYAEVVTAPALDGGYVLIGERNHHPQLFQDIPWSTPEVLQVTRRRSIEEGIVYREVTSWDDLDDMESLQRLLRRSPASLTAACARTLFAS